MKYGTIRSNTQDAIMSALTEHEQLRFGELSKIIVIDKQICSDRIFRETIAYMVEKKLVKKFEIARNNTTYTIDSKITPISDEDISEMLENVDGLKEETEKILKIISSDADDSDKSNEIINYLLLISIYEMQMMMLSHVSGKPKLKKYVNVFTKYKKDIIESLNVKSSSMFSSLGALINFKLFIEMLKQMPDELEHFANSVNEIKKLKNKTQ